MDLLPAISWAVSTKVSLVHDADRDTYRAFVWNFLIVGLIMGGGVGGSEGAQ